MLFTIESWFYIGIISFLPAACRKMIVQYVREIWSSMSLVRFLFVLAVTAATVVTILFLISRIIFIVIQISITRSRCVGLKSMELFLGLEIYTTDWHTTDLFCHAGAV